MGSHPSRWMKITAPEPIIFKADNSLTFDYDIEDDIVPKGTKKQKK